MSIELTMPELTELQPRITVMGVGGAGGNAVNNMIRSELQGVSFVVANTDAQALSHSLCDTRIQLGVESTQGLGAGSKPEVGEQAAEETLAQIEQHLDGCHMLFLAAGMGGGTGTGATPVIARKARERGILTIGVVTKPFSFEGNRRMKFAQAGIAELQESVDTLIIIPNQNLFRIATEKTTFQDAFSMADEVLNSGVRGITDLMVMPGLINLDFADVKTVMSEMGKAMMGTGEADGDRRAVEAAEAAISNPLLDEVSLKGAKGVIINITGGMDLTLFEVDEAAKHIRSQVDEDANIIVGSAFNEALNGQIRVSVVATGIAGEDMQKPADAQPSSASVVSFSRNTRPQISGAASQPRAEAAVARALEEEPVRIMEEDDARLAAQDAEEALVLEAQIGSEAEAPAQTDMSQDAALDESAAMDNASLDEADVEAVVANADVFIAPEPQIPSTATDPVGEPDVFAKADYENAGEPQVEKSRSLFRRMTSFGNKGGASAQSVADAQLNAKTEEAQKDKRKLDRLRPEDRPVPSSRSEKKLAEEQLEIPAFLRRQIN